MSTSRAKRLFCFGYGYTCESLGAALQAQGGWEIAGTTRDVVKREALIRSGIRAYIMDEDSPLDDPHEMLKGTTHLLISAPPDSEGDPVFRQHASDILAIPALEWVGYLSTTGVYGNRNGAWVDEQSEVDPTTIRGTRRARAEAEWHSLYQQRDVPVHIFRLAGIYGPGRSAIDSVRAGIARRIEKPGQAFSRVHVDDIVRVLLASMAKPRPGAVYNVCDDLPAPSHEVIAYACELLGRTPPPLIPIEEADLAPIARSFYADNKRVRNDRIKEELGVALAYPDYRAGLKACLEAEKPHSPLPLGT